MTIEEFKEAIEALPAMRQPRLPTPPTYNPVDWVNNTAPAINATNLSVSEQGLVNVVASFDDTIVYMGDLEQDIYTLDLKVNNLVNLSDTYGPWVDELRIDVTDLKNRMTQVENAITTLESDIERIEGDISVINTELSQHNDRLTTLENLQSGMAQDIATNAQGITNNAYAIAALNCTDVGAPCGTWTFDGANLSIGM